MFSLTSSNDHVVRNGTSIVRTEYRWTDKASRTVSELCGEGRDGMEKWKRCW